jgi:hypothetical protein
MKNSLGCSSSFLASLLLLMHLCSSLYKGHPVTITSKGESALVSGSLIAIPLGLVDINRLSIQVKQIPLLARIGSPGVVELYKLDKY